MRTNCKIVPLRCTSVKYLSGRQQSFRWHTTDPNPDVLAVYNRLVSFFEPLKAQADEVVAEPE